jgi:large subunit ribosomal protein L22
MPETTATLRYLRTSPYKVREVLALVRGRDISDARDILRFTERGPAKVVLKLLDSAVANAEHNLHISADELFVSTAYADEGPTLRRFRPRARGRATRIRKRTSHVTIVVARYSDEEIARRRQREAATGGRARRVIGRRRAAARAPAATATAAPEEEVTAVAAPEEAVTAVAAPEEAVTTVAPAQAEGEPAAEVAGPETIAEDTTPTAGDDEAVGEGLPAPDASGAEEDNED